MAREGLGIIVGMVIFALIMTVGAILSPFLHIRLMAGMVILLALITVYFFRDPQRRIPDDEHNIVSPADGKVIEIIQEREPDFFRAEVTRISIFLNIFDVHVNRSPIAGTVEFFRYKRGAFLKAYKSAASDVNEQTVIGILGANNRKVLFKQIAGLIARRIVCHIREGNEVALGERFGMIKFGSRVDVFLPSDVDIKVKLRDKVKGGESILGVFANEI